MNYAGSSHSLITDAAGNPAEILARYGADASSVVIGCTVDNGTMEICEHGCHVIHVYAGGVLRAGNVILRHGAEIRALDGGGFTLGSPCPQCAPNQESAPAGTMNQ